MTDSEKYTDQLPPEIARQIHPDRRKNEAAYWGVRDQYRGQWIGFADGIVIASGSSPVTVFHEAEASGRHPFFICVGREEEPCRVRRVPFAYDASDPGEALPLIDVEFRPANGLPGVVLDRVIPDTGAPAASRLCRRRAHPRARRSESFGYLVSRPAW